MQLPPETPKLPKLPFLVADALLLGLAVIIYNASARPLAPAPLTIITTCVALAAVCGFLPFLLGYTRARDEELAERQRTLEALARTTAETAEQIGIAAAGLNTIAESVKKSVIACGNAATQAQEKISALDAGRVAAASAEADALRAELAALRASETSRLEAVAEKISRAAAELTKLDRAPRKAAGAKSSEPASAETTPEATAIPAGDTAGEDTPAADPAPAIVHEPASAAGRAELAHEPGARPSGEGKVPPPADTPTHDAVAAALAAADAIIREIPAQELRETIAPFPIRPARRETSPPIAVELAAGPDSEVLSAPPRRKRAKAPAPGNESGRHPAAPPPGAGESQTAPDIPTPADTHPLAERPSRTRDSAPIFEVAISDDTPLSPEGHYPAAAAALTAPTAPPFPVRAKRQPAKPGETSRPPEAPRPAENAPPAPAAEAPSGRASEPIAERARSSDGLTRLIVTAYIGIGNKLFVRGDGPGLRPDVGVPLQFVSIGKWRWETADATAPLTVKLYKNDQQPCASPADVTLQPGHQHEVSADF